ncbi:hypothetical protein HHUSO_G31975 [Huso huso]|uniref:Uncharacterized protein n=1 Tax=Huso huso TaxID=61971 RepID=A0ABR0YB45_HUSHU
MKEFKSSEREHTMKRPCAEIFFFILIMIPLIKCSKCSVDGADKNKTVTQKPQELNGTSSEGTARNSSETQTTVEDGISTLSFSVASMGTFILILTVLIGAFLSFKNKRSQGIEFIDKRRDVLLQKVENDTSENQGTDQREPEEEEPELHYATLQDLEKKSAQPRTKDTELDVLYSSITPAPADQ